MANGVPEKVCWSCFCEDAHYAIIIEIIAELKKKKISSSFKNILERLHVGNEIPDISEELLGDVLDFAEKNDYVDIKTYKGNISYKVSDNYWQGECVTCGELIENSFTPPSNIKDKDQTFNNRNFHEYVDIKTFQILSEEVNALKQSLKEFDECIKLKEENKYLTLTIQEKDAYINTLTQLIANIQSHNNDTLNVNPTSKHYNSNEYQWNLVNRKTTNNRDFTVNRSSNIPLSNKFSVLPVEENFDAYNDRFYNDDVNIVTNSYAQKQATVGLNAGSSVRNTNGSNSENHNKKRPQVVTQNTPVNTKHPITVPGNSSYANLTTSGKKVCMFGRQYYNG